MKNKTKNSKKFKELIKKIEENRLFTEKEYNVLNIIITNLIAKTSNYVFESDFKSKTNLKAAQNYTKIIKKFDDNLTEIKYENLEDIIDHFNTINIIFNEIKNNYGRIINNKK